ncbi:eukaryotic translation initiation factor 4 gamma-like isoform X2 [Myzus persicae]|uniref:eukaryotic translation initiation factor 4 gamma-like isoform X2 n=1 Tax=Myzus persicae TaxID=13164 RepID=UPI000B93375C|nr:eukaryotic translation initiation factor 4 gamma-like isoform X2 [Myzus persicae]
MSNVQNSNGQSPIVPFSPMEKSTLTESLQQVPVVLQFQQPSTTSFQILEFSKHNNGRKNTFCNESQSQVNKLACESTLVPAKAIEYHKAQNFNRSVQSLLNKITLNNMPLIIECFKALPIDTIEHLEKTADFIFEKAINEQSLTPVYSFLCSAMQSVVVGYKDGKTASFKKLIISKCQRLFELDRAKEMDSDRKLTEINLCKDPEKKKELQLEFEENERRLLKRSIGNCRFIGELYKQKILTPNIILYCIVNLVKNHDEVSLECSCNLLKTAGEELEQCYCLNDTFDKLKALTSRGMKSKIPPRIKFMIQDVIELRRGKWISEKKDHHPGCNKFKGGEYKKCCRNDNNWNVGPNNTKYKQQNYTIDPPKVLRLQNVKKITNVTTLDPAKWSFNESKNMNYNISYLNTVLNNNKRSNYPHISQPGGTVKEPVPGLITNYLNSEVVGKINIKCKNILYEYEQMQNVDNIIYSLSEDKSLVFITRHYEFVKSLCLSVITSDINPITRTTLAGTILAELLSKKILSMKVITLGIDAVLKDWDDYLMDYPLFFSYIAAIIAPLLLSQNASFDFNNLKDSCTSIRPDNSSIFFTEVLNEIHNFKETQNIKEQLGGILWIYNKWITSENVSLELFMSNNQINKYLNKVQVGVFLLSIAIYDKIMLTDNKLPYVFLQSWIYTNFGEEIIKSLLFVQALTIAIVIVCS